MRDCGCNDRGRHKKTCIKHIERVENVKREPLENEYPENSDTHELYMIAYGKPPHLSWYPNRARQRTVERKIEKFVRRYKAFYLTTSSLDHPLDEEETWYIDGGNWASKKDASGYNILVGHIKNCLVFLDGKKPMWKVRRDQS